MRDYARELGLPVADKPDSHEICFVPDGDHAAFVERTGRASGGRSDSSMSQAGRRAATRASTASPSASARDSGLSSPMPLYVVWHRRRRAADRDRRTREALERTS